jgi:hypothetical protein
MRRVQTPGGGLSAEAKLLAGSIAAPATTGENPQAGANRASDIAPAHRRGGRSWEALRRGANPAAPERFGRCFSAWPSKLNQTELSRRWKISARTLERWRWLDQGPAYLKIGGRVAYRMEDIEAFEQARRRGPGVTSVAPVAW